MSGAPGIDVDSVKTRILDTLGAPADAPWYAAYSGGLDSTVLVHLLARICRDTGTRLVALHADHGLHRNSGEWRRRCEARCREWGVELHSTRLELSNAGGLGPEGRARAARYHWFREVAGEDAWLFTAHHRRDQAETLIERLTRGSGPRGLRGIVPVKHIHGMHVARPLLDTPREAIQAYAGQHRLRWVDDDSNLDSYFTRNYIRNQVLPVLAQRWPDIETALGRSARVMADAQQILDEEAADGLSRAGDRPVRGDPSLEIAALRSAGPARRRNMLQHWIHRETGASPGFARLNRISRALERYPEDGGGLRWPPVDLRLFRDRLYLVRPWPAPDNALTWDLNTPLRIGECMVLSARESTGAGLKKDAVAGGVRVVFRRGGEKCRLPARRHRHKLKHVLQESGVPPWQRPRIPLIVVAGEIAAIAGLACCDPFAAGPGEPGLEISVDYPKRGAPVAE